MKRLETILMTASLVCPATLARAQLWNALDTVPRPNAVIGYDTSVTMRIDVACSSCHRRGLPPSLERANVARLDILDTMELFRDYFIFGAFEYQGCGAAHIEARALPRVGDPDGSYTDARTVLLDARGCNSSENRYPTGASIRCITPTPYCSGDVPVVEAILAGGLRGLTIPPMPAGTSTVCGNPARVTPTFDLEGFLISQTAGMQWPRWDPGHITGRAVQEDFCDPLSTVLEAVRTELNRCLMDPTAFWDLSFLSGGVGSWCTPGLIANSACTTSPFVGTCVCDAGSDLACLGATGFARSDCGQILTWKARQQVAVCESYDPATFGSAYRSQPDNRINLGGCRENVAMFFTDGYQGHRPGVEAEANAAMSTYLGDSGQSNMFVFRIANSFRDEANRMMQYVSAGQIAEAFSAVDEAQMRTSFSQVLARIYQGDYAGASPTISATGDRVAISSFVVPGYTSGAPVSDRYIGWPNRIAFHEIDEAGNIGATPVFQTDWEPLARRQAACYHQIGGTLDALLGPGDQFDNGTPRTVTVPAGSLGDRDGDGVAEPPRTLRWGRSFGFGSTRPVVVEAPNETPDPAWGLAWAAHVASHEGRPRMIYTMGGGYVLGFHAGVHTGRRITPTRTFSHTYDDAGGDAGTEVLRYLPDWMRPGRQSAHHPSYDVQMNPLVPQRMTTGQLVAREVYVALGTEQFRTVLVGAQGKEGAGYFALDITEPCHTRLLAEWLLPVGAYASARPEIYYIPQPSAPERRAAVVTTGGLDGLPLILAYDVRDGVELARRALPAVPGVSYPTTPVCVDVEGEGVVTHCYVLRSDGYVARVEVRAAGFVDDVDLTPTGPSSPRGGGRVFSTEPVAFFGSGGAVNLVFGSGSHRDLTVPGPQNYVYKVVDDGSREDGVTARPGRLENVCVSRTGSPSDGVFPLPPGDRIVSAPIIADGVVAWTSYHTASTGCVAGSAALYAMRYDSCLDALTPTGTRPAPVPIGEGIPTSPVLHRTSGVLLARTSAGPDAGGVGLLPADTSGNGRPWARKLYWRYELDVR